MATPGRLENLRNSRQECLRYTGYSDFALRPSFGFRISAFGFHGSPRLFFTGYLAAHPLIWADSFARPLRMETEGHNTSPPPWLSRALFGRNPKRTLLRIVVLIAVCYVVFFSHWVLVPLKVEGVSMLPTYVQGRPNFINRLAYLFHEPRRGDIVGIRPKHTTEAEGASVPTYFYFKRIIGLPGETVAFHHGAAFVNGKALDEPYLKYPCDWEWPPEQLGPTDYFVVGDNRSMARTDHEWGKAFRKQILGKALL
jgi:signal peptidase I